MRHCVFIDVFPVLLGKQIRLHPIAPSFGKDDGAVRVVVQLFLEHPAAQEIWK